MIEELLVEDKNNVRRIAGLKEGRLQIFIIEDRTKVNEGNIYLGKITKKINTANGKEGYFINIGTDRDAFINAQENALEDLKAHEGQDVVVQVIQEQRAEKGTRMTRFLRLAGLYLVYCPYGNDIEISAKINDEDKREELIQWFAENMTDGGWIIRTQAAEADKNEILAEAAYLKQVFEEALVKAKNSKAPHLLVVKNNLLQELICQYKYNLQKITVNSRLLQEELNDVMPATYSATCFTDAGVEEQVAEALQKTVKLKCGGRIIIEETRACTAIDVDSGEGMAQGGIGRLNQEAAHEIARQIVLRNLSGKIIIDFAGIAEFKFLKPVMDILADDLAEDAVGSRIFGLSRAGNVEIIRTRRRPSLSDLLTEECPTCFGTGRVEK